MNGSNIAIITGGTGAVGRALVPLLVQRNFKLGITYIVPEQAAMLEAELDLPEDQLILRRVDAVDASATEDFFKETVETFGGLNVLVSLVGGWAGGRDVHETDDVRFDRMLDLNLRSAFNAVRAGIPYMRDQDWGRIVMLGSRQAVDPPAGQAAYNIAKAGVAALGKSVAREMSDTNVTCNVLLPSVIDTQRTREALPYADYVDWPKPDEIANVIDFLTGHRSAVIDGAQIPVWGAAEF